MLYFLLDENNKKYAYINYRHVEEALLEQILNKTIIFFNFNYFLTFLKRNWHKNKHNMMLLLR